MNDGEDMPAREERIRRDPPPENKPYRSRAYLQAEGPGERIAGEEDAGNPRSQPAVPRSIAFFGKEVRETVRTSVGAILWTSLAVLLLVLSVVGGKSLLLALPFPACFALFSW